MLMDPSFHIYLQPQQKQSVKMKTLSFTEKSIRIIFWLCSMGVYSSCCSSEAGKQPLLPNRPESKHKRKQKLKKIRNIETFDDDEFTEPYAFNKNRLIVMKHRATGVDLRGKYLRVDDVTGSSKIFGDGTINEFSVFQAMPDDKIYGKTVKLKSLYNGKYLRIVSVMSNHRHKYVIQCDGIGGHFCLFKVNNQAQIGHVKLESVDC